MKMPHLFYKRRKGFAHAAYLSILLTLSVLTDLRPVYAMPQTAADTVTFAIPDTITGAPADTVSIPLLLKRNGATLISLGAVLKATNGLLSFVDFTPGPIIPGQLFEVNPIAPDSIRLAFINFGDGPISQDGVLASFRFRISPSANASAVSELRLSELSASNADFNAVVAQGISGKVTVQPLTSIEEDALRFPKDFALSQNYPNPFNPKTIIKYGIPRRAAVRIEIFDMLGKRVRILIDGIHEAGTYEVEFEAKGLSSGLYVYKLTAPGVVATRKMVLIK